jgi:2-C-methyl-D-erythritol 4-phosphate cytidylyltransferase
VPVKDTIKLADSENLIEETLQRDRLWAAQTPQIFSFDMIIRAYENLAADATDDATVVERLGYKVQLYMGDYKNIKVTTTEDLALAKIIAGNIAILPISLSEKQNSTK